MVVALACAFTPVAFLRNARYWISILNGSFSTAGLPAYVLPVNVLPGWVLQTREFYNLPNLSSATAGQLLVGAIVPLILIAVIVFAARRHREALMMVAIAGGAMLLAYYTWSNRNCGYCVQRNLIPVGALAAPALGLGLAAIATLRTRGPHPARGGDRADHDRRHRPRGDRRAPAAGQRLLPARQPGSRGDFGPSGAIGSGRPGRVRSGPGAPDGAADGLQPG